VYGSIKEIKGSKMVFSLEGKRVEKNQKEIIVAEGALTYVAVNEKGKPRKFKPNLK
jgi:acyl-CoA thioesterase FadM